MSDLFSEFKLTVRQISRAPIWSAAVILTLALAIAVNTATFASFYAVLLRALPYADSNDLVLLKDQYRGRGYLDLGISEPEFWEYSASFRSFESLAVSTSRQVDVRFGDKLRRLRAAAVTGTFFDVLRISPRLGRNFVAEELAPGSDPAVVIVSDSLFDDLFGGDESKVEHGSIELDGTIYRVIGVLPPSFSYPGDLRSQSSTDLILPLVLDPANPRTRENPYLYAIGRLKEGATLAAAREEKESIVSRLTAATPEYYQGDLGFDISLRPLLDEVIGTMRQSLVLVLLMVLLTFFVALGNVATLILARLAQRRKETALRLALGARSPDLLRQFGVEALVLTILGGALGLFAGKWAFAWIAQSGSQYIPRLTNGGMAPSVFLYVVILLALAFGITMLASIGHLRGLLNFGGILREEAAGGTVRSARRLWGRSTLVVGQVAFSVCLLSASLLLVQSFRNMNHVELGLNPDNVSLVDLTLPAGSYATGNRAGIFYESLLQEVRALPVVEEAGVVGMVPLVSQPEVWPIDREGAFHHHRPGDPPSGVEAQVVSHGYFEAMGIVLIEGQDFDSLTDARSNLSLLVNETMAKLYWPDGNPVGHRLRVPLTPNAPWLTVIGVVADVKHAGPVVPPRAQAFYHHRQIPEFAGGTAYRWMTLVVKAQGETGELQPLINAIVNKLDSQISVPPIRSMQSDLDLVTGPLRFFSWALSTFSLLALVMTLIGLYGLISEMVDRRRQALAIRQALGASRCRIVCLVLGEAFRLVCIGLVFGLIGTAILSPLLSHNLYGISGNDVATLFGSSILLCLCAFLAGLSPALRAVSPSLLGEIHRL